RIPQFFGAAVGTGPGWSGGGAGRPGRARATTPGGDRADTPGFRLRFRGLPAVPLPPDSQRVDGRRLGPDPAAVRVLRARGAERIARVDRTRSPRVPSRSRDRGDSPDVVR